MTPKELEIQMHEALRLAQEAEALDEVPVGAWLIKDNEVIGRGHNRRETDKRAVSHAEIVALEDYSKRTGQWRLPVGTWLFTTTEPCLMCTGALLWARADHVVYGCRDPKAAGLERIRDLIDTGVYDHRFKSIQGGILETECSSLISGYFRKKRGK